MCDVLVGRSSMGSKKYGSEERLVLVSKSLLSFEQCIFRSNSASNNPTGCIHNPIPYSSDAVVCNNKKKAGITWAKYLWSSSHMSP